MLTPETGREPRPEWSDEILGVIRSEPGLAWFCAQGLILAQPFLEAFWTPERIEQLADRLQGDDGGRVDDRDSMKGSDG
jgi:hypothetical protein